MPITNVRFSSASALATALAVALAVSCGGSDGSSVNGGKGTASSTGTQPDLGNLGSGSGSGSPGAVTTITPGSECAKGSGVANAIPAVVEMVIDISQSMTLAPDGSMRPAAGMSKWDITKAALKSAVTKLPASIAVGVNFFPNTGGRGGPGGGGGMCINNAVALPIALLGGANSQQRNAFNQVIDRTNPNGGTPTHAAFNFGVETVKASMLTGRKFVLLITDGKPTYNLDCSGDGMTGVENAPLIAAVDAAFKDATSVSTFVIGSPGSEDARGDLSQMATKGGTAKAGCSDAGPTYCHLDMTTAPDFGAALTQGLSDIAGQIGTCEYAVPPPPAGQVIDPLLVNVLYTHSDGKQSTVPQDAAGKCESGWKYDNNDNPTKIILCGSDCDAVKGDQGAKIDVIFGCQRQTNVPVQ
jgi:hypothetical protein